MIAVAIPVNAPGSGLWTTRPKSSFDMKAEVPASETAFSPLVRSSETCVALPAKPLAIRICWTGKETAPAHCVLKIGPSCRPTR